MNEKVGRLTGKKTQAGRDVYETPEKDGTPHGSEMVSEKSTTFEFGAVQRLEITRGDIT